MSTKRVTIKEPNEKKNNHFSTSEMEAPPTTKEEREEFVAKYDLCTPMVYKRTSQLPAFVTNPPFATSDNINRIYRLVEPILVKLNGSQLVDCYMTRIHTLAFWELEHQDCVILNSLTYDLVKKRRMITDGKILYLERCDYNFFRLDAGSKVFDCHGQLVPINLATESNIEDVRGQVCLKVTGLLHNTSNGTIGAIIRVHQIMMAEDNKENTEPICIF